MTAREFGGYALLIILLLACAWQWARRRREVRRDRMMRWGTPDSPQRIKRRDRS